jgi:hypothetical protein
MLVLKLVLQEPIAILGLNYCEIMTLTLLIIFVEKIFNAGKSGQKVNLLALISVVISEAYLGCDLLESHCTNRNCFITEVFMEL